MSRLEASTECYHTEKTRASRNQVSLRGPGPCLHGGLVTAGQKAPHRGWTVAVIWHQQWRKHSSPRKAEGPRAVCQACYRAERRAEGAGSQMCDPRSHQPWDSQDPKWPKGLDLKGNIYGTVSSWDDRCVQLTLVRGACNRHRSSTVHPGKSQSE